MLGYLKFRKCIIMQDFRVSSPLLEQNQPSSIINEVMTRLSDQFIQDWFVRINKPEGKKGSNKLRTYKLFKEKFQLEYILSDNSSNS